MPLSRRSSLAVALLLVAAPVARAQSSANPTGHWEGRIQIPNREMALTVDLAKDAAGTWTGSLSIPSSTTTDVPLSDIAVENGAVRFVANLPGKTSFDGSLSADASGLSGTVANAQGGVPFELTRKGEANVKQAPRSSALTKSFEGTWQGTVDAEGRTMRVLLKLSSAADGTAVALLTNLDKDTGDIPVTTVTIDGAQLLLEVRVISGSYRGTLGASGEIAGEWVEGPRRLALTFRRSQ